MHLEEELPQGQPIPKTFPKEERLHHKKLIDGLFGKGSSFLVYPFKIIHRYDPEATPDKVQMLVVVPKRAFKKAHDRNRLKRQIREAYRHEKHVLAHLSAEKQLNVLGILYVAKEKLPFSTIRKKLSFALERCVTKKDVSTHD